MKNVLNLLKSYQTDTIPHTQVTLYDHLVGTGNLLETWKCHENLCLAGYCHSFYGTDGTGKKHVLKMFQWMHVFFFNYLKQYTREYAENVTSLR